jgi:hypothetical protein
MVNGTIAIGRASIMDQPPFKAGAVACSLPDGHGLAFLESLKRPNGDTAPVTDDVPRSISAANCA